MGGDITRPVAMTGASEFARRQIFDGFRPEINRNPGEEPFDWQTLLVWKNFVRRELEPCSSQNVTALLTHSPKYNFIFRLDEFADKVLVHGCPPWEDRDKFVVHALRDSDIVCVRNSLEREGLRPSKDLVRDGIYQAAADHAFHPPRAYFNQIQWDGTPRLHNWLTYYLGAESQPPEYLKIVGTYWMMGGVARIMRPGCKMDHMLVLEGEQGIFKSTALATLGTFGDDPEIEYFTDRITFGKIRDKDTIAMLQGKLIVEFSELAHLNNTEFEEIKAWITLRTDEARKPYGMEPKEYPRQFILAGTTNDSRWLRDPTGNRRFWPVRCGSNIDIETLKRDREQLWAEAVHLYKTGMRYWMERNDEVWKLAGAQQAVRLLNDPWTVMIIEFCNRHKFVTLEMILTECLQIEIKKQTSWDQRRVAFVLKSSGWEETTIKSAAGKRLRAWEDKNRIKTLFDSSGD